MAGRRAVRAKRVVAAAIAILLVGLSATIAHAEIATPGSGGGNRLGIDRSPRSQPTGGFVRLSGQIAAGLTRAIAAGRLRRVAGRGLRPSASLTVTVTLRRTRERAFERFLVTSAASARPRRRHFLSPQQQAARFGPTLRTYAQLEAWLRRQGLRRLVGSANRLTITATGSVRTVERAFRVKIDAFKAGRRGRLVYAAVQAPGLPAELAPRVESIAGLSNLSAPVAPTRVALHNLLCDVWVSLGYGSAAAALNQANAQAGGHGSQAPCYVPQVKSASTQPVFTGGGQQETLSGEHLGQPGAKTKVNVVDADNPSHRTTVEATVSSDGRSTTFTTPVFAARAVNYSVDNNGTESDPVTVPMTGSPPPARDLPGLRTRVRTASELAATGHAATSRPLAPPVLSRSSRGRLHAALDSPTRTGQKIGLLEYDTFNRSDVSDYLALAGLDPALLGHLSEVPINGGVASPSAGESEVLLDIDLALGAASGAQVTVYDAPPSTSFEALFNAMVSDRDTVISNSWAACEDQVGQAEAQSIDSVLASAAAAGVSVLNGSGDSGSTCLDGSPHTVAVPADSPHATAVGGTSYSRGPNGSYGAETWWDGSSSTPPDGQGGFGTSGIFGRPTYQTGFDSSSQRSVPDIAWSADPATAGYVICQADAGGCPTGLSFGGTSAATPLIAAYVADLDQALGRQLGELNPLLYADGNSGAFHGPAELASDFAHVGLGSPDFPVLQMELASQSEGAASAANSQLVDDSGNPPADGSSVDTVTAFLVDAAGHPVSGKHVTFAVTSSSGNATLTSPTGVAATDGAVSTGVYDTTAEPVTVTATDTDDNVALGSLAITFAPPQATGGVISASPSVVSNDGTSQATVSVYLQNDLGRPAVGKTVSLSFGGGAQVTPVGSSPGVNEAVTDSTGTARFTATDTSQETVQFTATDVSDGSLPVPGSATVTFEPSGSSGCSDAAPMPVSGYTISTWASGIPYDPQPLSGPGGFTLGQCYSMNGLTFDSSGNPYFADSVSGEIYRLGPAGGTVSQADALPDTPKYTDGDPTGIAFGSQGDLFVAQVGPQIEELNPATGQLERIAATGGGGDHFCGWGLATDPLSSDIFHTDFCSGSVASGEVTRLSSPEGASPTWSDYADSGGSPVGQLTFAPDGTMYVAVNGNDTIVSVSGTNQPSPPTVTTIATLPNSPYGIAVAGSDAGGHATALYVSDSGGNIDRIDLSTSPATLSAIASGGSASLGEVAVGPDGCLYVRDLDKILKVSGPGCSQAQAGPEIELTQSSGSATPPTGSPVGLSATLENFPSASGTPVHFDVSGPNLATQLVGADSSGTASFSYVGAFQGIDTVTAWAEENGKVITSAPVEVHWTPGKDGTFLSLNGSPEAGAAGRAVTMVANLTDVTDSPAAAIAGASVSISMGGQSCTAATDSAGNASCSLTPGGSQGLEAVRASYAGDNSHAPARASNVFELGGVGFGVPGSGSPPPGGNPLAPVSVGAPRISGSALPGDRLSCSPGVWSNSPSSFAYQWNRDGRAIAGAIGQVYTVQVADRAQTLTCSVTASNPVGSRTATSAGVLVALPGTLHCPRPTGVLRGVALGPLRLGMARRQARQRLRRFHVFSGFDDFCQFAGWGIRTGYPSGRLLDSLPRRERSGLAGRIVIALTGNPFYALRGVSPGMSASAARRRLRLGRAFRVGVDSWYFITAGTATGVVKVSSGVIQEVGLVEKQITRNRKAQAFLLGSWGKLPWGRQPP